MSAWVQYVEPGASLTIKHTQKTLAESTFQFDKVDVMLEARTNGTVIVTAINKRLKLEFTPHKYKLGGKNGTRRRT